MSLKRGKVGWVLPIIASEVSYSWEKKYWWFENEHATLCTSCSLHVVIQDSHHSSDHLLFGINCLSSLAAFSCPKIIIIRKSSILILFSHPLFRSLALVQPLYPFFHFYNFHYYLVFHYLISSFVIPVFYVLPNLQYIH